MDQQVLGIAVGDCTCAPHGFLDKRLHGREFSVRKTAIKSSERTQFVELPQPIWFRDDTDSVSQSRDMYIGLASWHHRNPLRISAMINAIQASLQRRTAQELFDLFCALSINRQERELIEYIFLPLLAS